MCYKHWCAGFCVDWQCWTLPKHCDSGKQWKLRHLPQLCVSGNCLLQGAFLPHMTQITFTAPPPFCTCDSTRQGLSKFPFLNSQIISCTFYVQGTTGAKYLLIRLCLRSRPSSRLLHFDPPSAWASTQPLLRDETLFDSLSVHTTPSFHSPTLVLCILHVKESAFFA